MNSYLFMPFVEIEVRLGTFDKKFDSCVDHIYFQKIIKVLESYQWKDIEYTETNEIINENIKKINDTKIIMKENVITNTIQLKNSPFDIRFSVNQEFELSTLSSFNNPVIRNKKRKSFINENFKYDLTEVDETINNITKKKYEVELELLVTRETLTWNSEYIHDYLECKIYDLVNIVEPMEREKFKVKLLK
uniref:mRNA 5'-phosphatase n=1 Tax=viral metagenome TaxID=1070528 RepID=A0A6C0I800_9ZZZZ